MEKIRLQKLIAESGICSRRKAEEFIIQGKVSVNGRPASIGDSATYRDIIAVDGKNIVLDKKHKKIYIMLNKPRGYVVTMSDELDRRCVTDLLTGLEDRVYPVGRLDRNSEGLLLLTNDGDFANDMTHPSKHISKTYRVTVRPSISDEQLTKLATGVMIDGRMTAPANILVLTQEENRVVLQIVLHEGRNREIRKMCEAIGLEVARLRRTAIGPLKLGMLKPGTFRELTPDELKALKNAVEKTK